MTLDQIIIDARNKNASDIHLSQDMPVVYRIHGFLKKQDIAIDVGEAINHLLNESQKELLQKGVDVDFSYVASDNNRTRVNIYKQQNKLAATIRLLNEVIPDLQTLGLPQSLYDLAKEPRGLILITGPTGSGKSTTLASLIDYINENQSVHIITIEDPIEYTYQNKLALIHQREKGVDTLDFASALRSSLREDPDIILVGEMRDYETISAALTAAETGHLVLSTLHTTSASQTIDRIIDACPSHMQNQMRAQLSGVLKAVVTQCLMPNIHHDGRVVATEILVGTDAVNNLIREGKIHQIPTLLQSGQRNGMHTLNMDLARLVRLGKISIEQAFQYSNNREDLKQYL